MIANVTHFLFFFRSDRKLDISWLKTKTTIPIGFQYRTLLQLCYRASGFLSSTHSTLNTKTICINYTIDRLNATDYRIYAPKFIFGMHHSTHCLHTTHLISSTTHSTHYTLEHKFFFTGLAFCGVNPVTPRYPKNRRFFEEKKTAI